MKINYTFDGNDFEDGDDFEYEVDYYDVSSALINIVYEELCGKLKKQVNRVLNDDEKNALKSASVEFCKLDIREQLEEVYEQDLKDYFEQDALEQYKDECEYSKDPLGYYGMKQSDFM
jgi:hypothetical protein